MPSHFEKIRAKVEALEPLILEEGLMLYEEFPLPQLQALADARRRQLHGDAAYYNKNIHIEPTNKCVYSCKFCAFYRKPKATTADGAWDYDLDDIDRIMDHFADRDITEVHVTGGVHPNRDLQFWADLIRHIKTKRPGIHVKAYTAVEIAWMAKMSKQSFQAVLAFLQKAGLDSLPGGGAEIFDIEVRRKIAGGKAPTQHWLEIHETAHQLGMKTNATMLYGHVESFRHRLEHMLLLRDLQDRTGGFNAFIPLKYRNENNALSHLPELTQEDDLRNYAVARLMLHNIKHLKAYWAMIGLDITKQSLDYGVDDLDGTIDDTTKIYSMAGSIENPTLSSQQLEAMIRSSNRIPIERNSIYQPISTAA